MELKNVFAIEQEETLREKRLRVNETQDWSAAADVIAHSKSGEQITIENLKFNSGGSLNYRRFRHSSVSNKLEHAANRRGKIVKRVSASNSSKTCPKCQARVVPDADRITRCDCSWTADRDYTAAVVLGQRGLKIKKLSIKKNRPTPKRPQNRVRNKTAIPFKNTAWIAFTGAHPAEVTGDSFEISATSVIDNESISLSSILKT